MPASRYRLQLPTIALFFEEGRQVAHTVPALSTIAAETIEGDGMIEVFWVERNEKILMFAQDLRNRGERLEET